MGEGTPRYSFAAYELKMAAMLCTFFYAIHTIGYFRIHMPPWLKISKLGTCAFPSGLSTAFICSNFGCCFQWVRVLAFPCECKVWSWGTYCVIVGEAASDGDWGSATTCFVHCHMLLPHD